MKTQIHSLIVILLAVGAGCESEKDTLWIGDGLKATLESGIVIREDGGDGRVIWMTPTATNLTTQEIYRTDGKESFGLMAVGPNPSAPTDFFQIVVPNDPKDLTRKKGLLRYSGVTGQLVRYDISSDFSSMTFDPTGTKGLLKHGSETSDNMEGGFINPNEVAILDLNQAPSATNPSYLNIDLNGHRIEAVSFLPEISVGGVARRFAVFSAKGIIRIMDLVDPTVTLRVPLTTGDDPYAVVPDQILVRPGDDAREPMLFVASRGTTSIYAISLGMEESSLTATINQYEMTGYPQDMTLYNGEDQAHLLVLSRLSGGWGGQLSLVDIDTSDVIAIDLEDSPNRMLRRTSATNGEEIVMYGSETNRIYFLKLEGLLDELGRNLEEVLISDSINQATYIDSNRLLIDPIASYDLILFNLETRKPTRFATGGIEELNVQIESSRLFFSGDFPRRIDMINLATEQPESLILDDEIYSLHLIRSSGMGVAWHSHSMGKVTLFPLANPVRSAARVVEGIWTHDMLEDGEEVAQ